MNLIKTGDFCQIVSDKFTEYGVKRNHLVYVVGHRALPIDETDPYTQRINFLVRLVDKNGHFIHESMYLMDPRSLQKVGKLRQKKLTAAIEKDFNDEQYATGVIGG